MNKTKIIPIDEVPSSLRMLYHILQYRQAPSKPLWNRSVYTFLNSQNRKQKTYFYIDKIGLVPFNTLYPLGLDLIYMDIKLINSCIEMIIMFMIICTDYLCVDLYIHNIQDNVTRIVFGKIMYSNIVAVQI